jgi:hypothetical protein
VAINANSKRGKKKESKKMMGYFRLNNNAIDALKELNMATNKRRRKLTMTSIKDHINQTYIALRRKKSC